MAPSRIVRPDDWPTVVLPAAVDPPTRPFRVVGGRAARLEARRRRGGGVLETALVAAAAVFMIGLVALAVWGRWLPL